MSPSLDGPSDRELVGRCLAGDEHAWEALIRRYQGLVYSVPLRYRATRQDAEDIVQSVFLELFNELPRLRNRDNLAPWIVTVARHQAYHWKRKRIRRAGHEVEGAEEVALDTVGLPPDVEHFEEQQRIRVALSRLPERCRRLVEMLFMEDPPRPYDQVAGELGLAMGSIGLTRKRCLNKLLVVLEGLDP